MDFQAHGGAESRRGGRLMLVLLALVVAALAGAPAAGASYGAVSWGENLYRQLGDGTNKTYSDVPEAVSALSGVTAVYAGGRHSLALLSNGTVMTWGNDEFGQLGNGLTETLSNVPVTVKGLSGVTAISAGGNHSLALLSNGTVMAWGENESGQLGDGNVSESSVPVAVKGLSGVSAISAGGAHSLALLKTGTVMAWGNNESGQLGDGNLKQSDVPVAVHGLSGVSAIAAGGAHSLALLSNGAVMAWGSNEVGQLGQGPPEEGEEDEFRDVPVAVPGLSGVSAIAAGGAHSLALLKAGTVMAWGEDLYGQVGNGTATHFVEAPVAVSGLSGVSAIGAGGRHSVALLGNGTVMSWGDNEWGILGEGTSGGLSDLPVTVSGLSGVKGISAGSMHTLAYGEAVATVTHVSPNSGSSNGGTSVEITGDDLGAATAVKFGSVGASSVTVNSATSITAIAPPGKGIVNVTVTTPGGISPTGPADRFTYVPAPTIKKLAPATGSAAGGTSVTITGTEFTGATAVRFGSAEASSFTVNSATSITAVSPPGLGGTVDVTVTTPAGTSAISAHDRFKYTLSVTGVSPDTGSKAGGATVTVTGAGFAPGATATTIKFGLTKATTVDCASSTECTVVTPKHAVGTVDVTATVNALISPKNPPADSFTYS